MGAYEYMILNILKLDQKLMEKIDVQDFPIRLLLR